MSDCPLVRLASNHKILKKLDESGIVTISLADWLRFFEALAIMNQDGSQRLIYCAIIKGHLIFSKTSFKQKPDAAPSRKADR